MNWEEIITNMFFGLFTLCLVIPICIVIVNKILYKKKSIPTLKVIYNEELYNFYRKVKESHCWSSPYKYVYKDCNHLYAYSPLRTFRYCTKCLDKQRRGHKDRNQYFSSVWNEFIGSDEKADNCKLWEIDTFGRIGKEVANCPPSEYEEYRKRLAKVYQREKEARDLLQQMIEARNSGDKQLLEELNKKYLQYGDVY